MTTPEALAEAKKIVTDWFHEQWPHSTNLDPHVDCDYKKLTKRIAAHLGERREEATEQEEAFEVWAAEVCKHGPRGTHANLKALAECLLSELHEVRAQAAAHSASVLEIERRLIVKDDLIGRLRDLLVDASYLMQHFKEDDAAYRGWREKGKALLAETGGR